MSWLRSPVAYPHISLETIVRLNPDVILDASMMGDSADDSAAEARLRQPWLRSSRIERSPEWDGRRT